MAAAVIDSLLLLAAAAVLGTAICRFGGLREVRGPAPAVGFAALMGLAAPAVRLSSDPTWVAVALAVLVAAALCTRPVRLALRERLGELATVTAGALAFLCLPWLAAGRFGVLGMGVQNDTAAHLVAAQWLVDHRMPVHDTLVGDGYPIGPHALAAVFTSVGSPMIAALSAVAIAGPVTTALSAADAIPVARPALRRALAVFVGLSYLTAAYYAQMAFKEIIEAGLVLAFALVLPAAARAARNGRAATARAALAPAVLVAGMVHTLSWPGMLWPLATLAGCVAVAAPAVRRHARTLAAAALTGAIAIGLLIVVELPRAVAFQSSHYAHEPDHGLGNLAGPLPPYEALGVWLGPDFRLTPHLPVLNAVLVVAAGALAVAGVAAWRRRPDDRALIGALAGGWLVWALLALTKNGYNAAKGLVVVGPLVALAVVAGASAAWRARPRVAPAAGLRFAVIVPVPTSAGRRAALSAVAAAVLCAGAVSSAWALRDAAVGPDAHHRELRTLAAAAPPGPMLVLDSSDFIAWDLYGVDVWRPPLLYVVHTAPTRPQKPRGGGQPFDLDSVTSATLNRFASVLTARNAAGSVPPPGLRVLRTTPSYVLYERVATVPRIETLGEGWEPGKVLDCTKAAHRAISRLPGWAIVRPAPVIATAPGWHGEARVAGSTASRTLSLPPGRWNLSMQYVSRQAMDVTVGGHTTTLPANLDRLGPLFATGTTPGGRVAIRVRVHNVSRFAELIGAESPTHAFDSYRYQPLGAVVATRDVPPERVPLSQACGRYVDHYLPGR